MSNFYKTDELIESVKQRAFIPSNQNTFTTEKFLRFANEEMMTGIVPTVMLLHEEHFVFTELIPLEANKSRYAIPYRAMGSKLYEVAYLDSGNNLFEMTRITRDKLTEYSTTTTVNTVYAFFIENDEIVLVPSIGASTTGSLQISYYLRPNKLVEVSRAGKITGIDRTTGVITLEAFPTHFTTSILFDFIKNKSPHIVLGLDKTPSAVSSTLKTVTFATTAIPDRLVIGDYLLQSEETIIPTIPSDLHANLAQRIACRCLEAMGDTQGLTNATAKLKEMDQALTTVIDNRVENSPQKIVNRWGHLRNQRYNSFRRY